MDLVALIALVVLAIWLWWKNHSSPSRSFRGKITSDTHVFSLGGGNGEYELDVVGESYYLSNLRKIAGPGEVYHECSAVLRMEEDNPHDPKAVAVFINGMKVGYLRRHVAADYRTQVEPYGNLDGTCAAVIIGGGEGRPYLGVWLDLPTK